MKITRALSIDWEDYFQVYNFSKIIKYENWNKVQPRLENNTLKLLKILKKYNTKATFFILGWNAEKFPKLVKLMHKEGHEIATHGYSHKPIFLMNEKEFEEDLVKSISIIKKITKRKPIGYRASTFSITKKTLWALDILKKHGIKYDSSMIPVKHPDYGIKCKKEPFIYKDIIEFPITTYKNLPIGGGYFRLYPYFFTKYILKKTKKSIIYIHPWEIDYKQPKYKLPFLRKFRHYVGLKTTEKKLIKLLKDFKFDRIDNILHLK